MIRWILRTIISFVANIIRTTKRWTTNTKEFIIKAKDWIIETYYDLVDAFTGWDMQLHNIRDEAKRIAEGFAHGYYVAIRGSRKIVREITSMLTEMLDTMQKGWK